MSNENQETIADIVREMRQRFEPYAKSDSNDARYIAYLGYAEFADRIEAAANREREAGAWAAQICGEIGEMIGREATIEKSSQVGNAAAMREALSDACYAMFNFLKTKDGGYEEMAESLDKAKASLAEPPRNCDKFNSEMRGEMSDARVKVNFVSVADARTVIVKVSGLTRDEQRKLRAVVDNRVRLFVDTVNRKESK